MTIQYLLKTKILGLLYVCLLLSCAQRINMTQEHKEAASFASLLHEAAAEGNVQDIEKAIKYGNGVNFKDQDGNTPLHLAVLNKHWKAVEKLLSKMLTQP